MKTTTNKATPRVYYTLRQIVQKIPRWLIEKTANEHGVDVRKFSATSHFVMLILGHLSRASCLTEISDETIRLKTKNTVAKYPQTFRRVCAIVEVNGEKREMTFLTNNTK